MPRSRQRKQGQAKTERVNESEPMQASSDQPSAKRLTSMYKPYVKSEFQKSLWIHHRLRGIVGTPPSRISRKRNRKTPMRSASAVPQSQERANSSVDAGCPKKPTPAAERHGEYLTCWIGPYPTRKCADVG